MPRLAANLSMLFNEYPFLERFDRAAAAGFRAVEFLFPYDEDIDAIEDAQRRNDLELVLFNLPAGNWAAGERGIACRPDRVQEFRAGVQKAVELGPRLGAPRINCLAGFGADIVTTNQERQTLEENLVLAADALAGVGIELMIEPVNTLDVPGFAVSTTRDALSLIDHLKNGNLWLQFDIYHSLRMGEDPLAVIRDHIDQIHHIQIADIPGRHQPGTGEVDFGRLFERIDESGYQGWVSLEYNPDGPTEGGFDLVRAMGLLDEGA